MFQSIAAMIKTDQFYWPRSWTKVASTSHQKNLHFFLNEVPDNKSRQTNLQYLISIYLPNLSHNKKSFDWITTNLEEHAWIISFLFQISLMQWILRVPYSAAVSDWKMFKYKFNYNNSLYIYIFIIMKGPRLLMVTI